MKKSVKVAVFVCGLLPSFYFVWLIAGEKLGPDPAKLLVDFSGLWALRFLWITLAITPLRHWFGWSSLLRFRRMLGLYAFFYASIHFLAVMTLILAWDVSIFLEELAERPYITVGFAAWVILLVLAITSFKVLVRKLGKRWKSLHQTVYVAAILVCVHFIWLVRSDYREVLFYSGIMAVLLLTRVYKSFTKVRNRRLAA